MAKIEQQLQKEIKRNRYIKSNFYDVFDKIGIADTIEKCEKLKTKYVCNNCPLKNTCNKHHIYYEYRLAQKHYDEQKVLSRSSVDITPEEINAIEEQIVPLIKNKKQSVNQVFINHPDILYFSKTTFYNYVNMEIFSLTNADLPKLIRYNKRKKGKNKSNKRELALLNGRRYEDFVLFTANLPQMNIVEMDTVIGQKDNKKCLLILYIRRTHFMLIFLLNKKDSASVNARINFLKEKLGIKIYSKVFRIFLTDNGTEFFSVLNFEKDLDNDKRVSNIFFCHPYSSYEKHGVEVNHEYIRRVLPKGTSFNDLNDDIVKKLQDNINAIPRLSLNGKTPYDLTKKLYPEFIELLECQFIEPDNVSLAEEDILFIKDK